MMARTRGRPLGAALRFVASVLMVSGTLLLADAGLTLLWQEPLSALQASVQQGKLEDALAKPPRRVLERHPLHGDAIGQIRLPSINRSYYVVEGTRAGDLRKGPGHYSDTPLPGSRGTVAIAGHRTTHGAPFRKVDQLHHGDRVILDMPWGRFTYSVEKTKIVLPTELSVKRRVAYNRLILSACDPLYSASHRIVVFAREIGRGPPRVSKG